MATIQDEIVEVEDRDLCDEDFAIALVANAEYFSFDEMMEEARRLNDEAAAELEASCGQS